MWLALAQPQFGTRFSQYYLFRNLVFCISIRKCNNSVILVFYIFNSFKYEAFPIICITDKERKYQNGNNIPFVIFVTREGHQVEPGTTEKQRPTCLDMPHVGAHITLKGVMVMNNEIIDRKNVARIFSWNRKFIFLCPQTRQQIVSF